MHTVKSIGRRLEKEEAKLTKKPDHEAPIDIFFDNSIKIANSKQILDYKLDSLRAGDKVLAKDINLKIKGPEKICIIGKNGVGKTTLLKKLKDQCQSLNLKVGYMPQSYFEYEKKDINAIEYISDSFIKDNHTKASNLLASLNFKREKCIEIYQTYLEGKKQNYFSLK